MRRHTTVVSAASVAAALVSPTLGSPPQPYALGSESGVTMRHCMPPCLCPYHEFTGPVAGDFLMTFIGMDPLGFDKYLVTGIEWTAIVNAPPFPQVIPIKGSGTYRIGGPLVGPVQQLVLTLTVGADPARVYDSGLVLVDPAHPFPEFAIAIENEISECRQNVFKLVAGPDGCYADCTEDGGLTVADFGCFQTRFVAGDPYADCNGVGGLTVADFACYQNAFVAGCP